MDNNPRCYMPLWCLFLLSWSALTGRCQQEYKFYRNTKKFVPVCRILGVSQAQHFDWLGGRRCSQVPQLAWYWIPEVLRLCGGDTFTKALNWGMDVPACELAKTGFLAKGPPPTLQHERWILIKGFYHWVRVESLFRWWGAWWNCSRYWKAELKGSAVEMERPPSALIDWSNQLQPTHTKTIVIVIVITITCHHDVMTVLMVMMMTMMKIFVHIQTW